MSDNFLKNYILNFIIIGYLLCNHINAAPLREGSYIELSNEQAPIILQRDKQLHFLAGAGVSKAIFLSPPWGPWPTNLCHQSWCCLPNTQHKPNSLQWP